MTSTDSALTTDRTTPRVLLFGHPRSGKSFLLGALLQAGEVQGETLGVGVIDPTGRLDLLRDHIYHGTDFEHTRTELVTFALQLLPLAEDGGRYTGPQAVVVMDCDGSAANALLKHPDPLTERSVRGTVASAVVRSDLIALVINAGADDDELDTAFDEFVMFLERVHGRKAFEREVGGFPIFLVLAQCDQLAEPHDTRAEWEARVRGNRKHALKRFEEFLDDQSPESDVPSPYLPFGSVELEAYAVAVRWPELADDPHPPDEPFGVAELFRDMFTTAKAHRDRVRTSDRRLAFTMWSLAITVLALLAGAVAVTFFQPPPADPGLADRVRAFEEREQPAAARLAEKHIARNKRGLLTFQTDPGFFALPEDLRAFVSGRLREIEDYESYRARLAEAPAPSEARTLQDLTRTESVLTTDLALPPQYTWGETEAAHLRDKWLADVSLLRAAESGWNDWYRGLVNQALALTHTRSFDGDWRGRVSAVDVAGDLLPFNPSDPIPGSEAVPQPRGEPVPYQVPFEFDRVYQSRRDWDFARARLLHLRDLADALGLTPDPGLPGRRVLDIPPPGPGINPLLLPGDRLVDLRRYFPRPSPLYPLPDGAKDGAAPAAAGASNAYPEWEISNFPEPGRSILAGRIRESSANGVRLVQGLILDQLGRPAADYDTQGTWMRVGGTLGGQSTRDWGHLLQILARLENPQAADPVTELAAFLGVKQFDLDIKGVDLAIPLALRVPALVPTGPATITLTPRAGGLTAVRTFKSVGEGTPRDLVHVYRFEGDTTGPLSYRPGDGFRVEVPVRSGDQRFTLVWDEGRTRTFQFDRMSREPKLVPANAIPEPATGVTLTPTAGSTLPRIPSLLPDVRR
ncbi:MAG: hypothetical protein JWO38_1841 [Gemmataceae bacterium]|nr:hypothetical protein [Gemmataceae bacterium]